MTVRMISLLLAGLLSEAGAQGLAVTADGTAFGSRVSLGGQPSDELSTADTDQGCPNGHGATAPGSFVCRAPAEGGVSIPGVATVVNSGSSITFGVAEVDSPCDSKVTSTAGQDANGDCPSAGEDKNSVIVAAPGPPPLAEAANTCSQATASGTTGLTGKSFVQSATINGSPVPIDNSTDTTISEGNLVIRLNHSTTTVDPGTGTLSIQQDAVRIQVGGDGADVVQLLLSGTKATLGNLPASCPAFHCPGFDSRMDSAFETDEGCPTSPDAGDQLRFTLEVLNTGGAGATSLLLADRIPENASLDPASPMLDGQPVAFDTTCPGTVTFAACPRSSGDTPQCLTVEAGDLPAGASKILTFTVTVNSTGDVCNTAVTSAMPADALCNRASIDQEISRLIRADASCPSSTTPTPNTPMPISPTPTPGATTVTPTPGSGVLADRPRTTGSGGCTIDRGGASASAWPVLLIGLLWVLRRRRSHTSRSLSGR